MAAGVAGLAPLLELTTALNGAESVESVVRATCESAAAACEAEIVSIGQLRAGGVVIDALRRDGAWEYVDYEPPPSGSITTRVLASGLPYRSDDLAADPHSDRDDDARRGFRTQLSVPLLSGDGGAIAVITLYNKRGGEPFTADDQALVTAMAARASVALERARARAELARLNEALRQSEARARAQYLNSPLPAYTWQLDGDDFVLIDHNDAAEVVTEGRIREVLGVRAGEFYADMPELLDSFRECVRTGRAVRREMEYRYRTVGHTRVLTVWYTFAPPDLVMVHTEDITERVRAEEALRRQDARFRSLVQHASDIVTVVGADGVISYVSPSVERYLGYRPDELIGRNGFDLLHADDLAGARDLFARGVYDPASPPPSGVYRARHRDGSWRWHEAQATNLLDDPAVAGVVINGRDVTDRVLAEEALRRSEGRFRSLVQMGSDIITLVDPAGEIRYISPAAERVLGYTQGEMVGTNVFAHLHPDDVRELLRRIAAVGGRLRAGVNPTVIVRHRHRDGSWRYLEAVSNNLQDDPAVGAIVINSRDVTERVQAEEALRESEAKLRLVVAQMPGLLWTTDRELRVTSVYGSGAGAAEIDAERYVGRTLGEFFRGEAGREPTIAAHRSALAGTPANYTRLMGRRDYEVHVEPLRDADDAVIGCVSLAVDVTERKETAARLQDLVGRLLSAHEEERRSIAYELHDGLAQTLAATHQHLQSYARRFRPRGEAGRVALETVLALARQSVRETRRVVAALRPTVLDDLGLEAALRAEVQQLRAEGWMLAFEQNLGDERLPAPAEIALFRAAQEALNNIRRHAEDRRVQIVLHRDAALVTLDVMDWGKGFDLATLEAAAPPGGRIGLASMQEQVALLGGTLRIDTAPGKGMCVHVEIPQPAAVAAG